MKPRKRQGCHCIALLLPYNAIYRRQKDDGMMFLCLGAMIFNMHFGELCGQSQRKQRFSSDLSHVLCRIVIERENDL